MLKKLKINNFTVFSNEDVDFSSHLTVCIGENATGKSHILKLVYVILKLARSQPDTAKEVLARKLGDYLKTIFGTQTVGRLVTRQQGMKNCTIEAQWGRAGHISFEFSTRSSDLVTIKEHHLEPLPASALFIPPKEILSIFSGFQAALETRELTFDATYLDLAKSLNAAPLKGPRLQSIREYLNRLETALEAEVRQEHGHFYFYQRGSRKGVLEAPLVAEGHRKLGMLAYLLLNGTLMAKSTLVWDEPEANLNPRLLRSLAQILFQLSDTMQVVIATHSLFLLKEFEILSANKTTRKNIQFIGLTLKEGSVAVEQAKSIDDLSSIVSLDEELEQSDRFMQLEE